MIISGKYLIKIRVETKNRFIVDEGSDSSNSIGSDSGEFYKFFGIIWEYSTVFLGYHSCSFEHISSSGIVPESLIVRKEFFIRGSGKRFYGREYFQDIFIISNHSIDLGLLEEYLREPNMIAKIFFSESKILPPGKTMATVFFGPV